MISLNKCLKARNDIVTNLTENGGRQSHCRPAVPRRRAAAHNRGTLLSSFSVVAHARLAMQRGGRAPPLRRYDDDEDDDDDDDDYDDFDEDDDELAAYHDDAPAYDIAGTREITDMLEGKTEIRSIVRVPAAPDEPAVQYPPGLEDEETDEAYELESSPRDDTGTDYDPDEEDGEDELPDEDEEEEAVQQNNEEIDDGFEREIQHNLREGIAVAPRDKQKYAEARLSFEKYAEEETKRLDALKEERRRQTLSVRFSAWVATKSHQVTSTLKMLLSAQRSRSDIASIFSTVSLDVRDRYNRRIAAAESSVVSRWVRVASSLEALAGYWDERKHFARSSVNTDGPRAVDWTRGLDLHGKVAVVTGATGGTRTIFAQIFPRCFPRALFAPNILFAIDTRI